MSWKLPDCAEMQAQPPVSRGDAAAIVVDACVLANARVGDVLLRLAAEGGHNVYWSRQILEETERTQLVKLGWEP